MVRLFCIVPLALAAVSAVSGHVIRRQQHKAAPSGWETSILQNYDDYHVRYIQWDCQKQHNTTFFDECCHPLLKGEPISVLENLGCGDGCDDGDSSAPPSSTPPSSSQPAQATTPPPATSSSLSKPASGAIAKGDDSPAPSSSLAPSSSPTPTTPTSTPPKSSTSPPPAQTSGSGSGNGSGSDENKGGQATFFTQNDTPGACGVIHQDSDLICALDSAIFNLDLCGKSVFIQSGDQSVTVTVADECPSCKNRNSIDLSKGAFDQLGSESTGVLPIEWKFV